MGTFTPLLEVAGIRVCYGSRPAVDEASFCLEAGQCVGLLGPNGSGKTSLLKGIAGLAPIESGHIRFRGNSFLHLPPQERAQKIVYVPDDFSSEFPISVSDAVMLGGKVQSLRGAELQVSLDRVLDETQCESLRHRMLAELSHGERQKIGLAKAFLHGAKVMLLDEAFSAMDLRHQRLVSDLLKRKAAEGMAFLIVGHDMRLISYMCPRSILLDSGKVIFDGEAGRLTQTNLIADVFGVPGF